MGMTEQQAIEELKCYVSCSGTTHPEEIEMGIKALEKQIPSKPNIWGDGEYDGQIVYDMYDCPNCGKSYEIDDEYDYCPNCGQRIDWSNEDD